MAGTKVFKERAMRTNTVMETIEIGTSGLVASRIALGTWAIGGWMWGGTDTRSALRTIDAAIDRGITLIDTAPVYGFGRSEEIVGRALQAGHRRDRVLIATKCGLSWQGEKVFRNAAPWRIQQEVEESLRRLRTDRIDLYQVHWPDALVPIEETAAVLARLFCKEKFARSASATSVRRKWKHSARPRHCMRHNRPTICSSARSRPMSCPMQKRRGLRCSPMARCAVAC
jgi:aryl-alcohol dehydrogenase-like predicted oxidoreductase